MNKVAIVTDSSACLPLELVRQYDIHVAPLLLRIEGITYLDGVDISPGEFYARLRGEELHVSTSSPSPEEFLRVFRHLSHAGHPILAITYSSQFGMAYQSALMARQEMGDYPIEVLDSCSAAMAQGFVALQAARRAEAGDGLAEVAAAARETIPRVGFFGVLETLTYLHKSGRVPAVAEWAGKALHLHPIFMDKDGAAGFLDVVRTPHRAVERILDELAQRSGGDVIDAAVFHADAPEQAEFLRQRLYDRFQVDEYYMVEFTPVMGAHAGPGVFGLAYHQDVEKRIK